MSISSHLYREKRDELTLGPLGGKTVVWHLSYFKKKGVAGENGRAQESGDGWGVLQPRDGIRSFPHSSKQILCPINTWSIREDFIR